MKLAVTGHRPDKLGGYGWDVFARLVAFAETQITALKPSELISGMALGWDMATAVATIRLRDAGMPIALTCAVPFSSQYAVWKDPRAVFTYTKILCKADTIVVLRRGVPASNREAGIWLDERNHWMVDHGDHLMALWNGARGGTRNAVYYAMEHACPYTNVWDNWRTF